MWEIRIQHEGLKAFRVVKGQTQDDANLKAEAQLEIWNQRWTRQLSAERHRLERLGRSLSVQHGKAQAVGLSNEAIGKINAIETLLETATIKGVFFEWHDLKDRTSFSEPPLTLHTLQSLPPEPSRNLYSASLSIIDKLIKSRRDKKEEAAMSEYNDAHSSWKRTCETILIENKVCLERNEVLHAERNLRQAQHKSTQAQHNAQIDSNALAFSTRSSEFVEYFFSEMLSRSDYPESFPEEVRLQYDYSSAILIVDYELPNMSALPSYKDVKYIAAKQVVQAVPVSEAWLKKTYDDMLYQIALRTIFELFVHDPAETLESVVFNGWVRSIDRSTGVEAHACIMSIHAMRGEFMAVKLDQVEPKACFRKLKGVASSKLTELTPIRPVMSVSREDKRFVDSYTVVGSIEEKTNLASMDWFDFENLIREVFEKEFSKNGGEVRITQASRDGGVDAIAFDPDPIRGGKIVIQAKRYTNVVGVAAVRDLYGTVHNEGATKGILVTTSSYGPDAYEFAKGKPLTLLSGSELLYLLDQHGHKANIDIAAARTEFKDKQKT